MINMRILHGEIESPLDFNEDSIAHYDSTHDCELSFNLDDNIVKVNFEVSIKTNSYPETNKEEVRSNFKFAFFYLVENLNDLSEVMHDKTISLKGGLGTVLSSITYSTTRGILMTRFNGTSLKDFVLPIINPNDLLK